MPHNSPLSIYNIVLILFRKIIIIVLQMFIQGVRGILIAFLPSFIVKETFTKKEIRIIKT